MNLIERIQQGESETLEFKRSFDKETIETVCAIANAKGGQVVMGVNDSGAIVGVQLSNESIQHYLNQIKTQTEPGLVVDIDAFQQQGKTVLVISVGEFPIKPVSFKGRFYKRKANSNHQLNLTEIANLHLQSLQLSWDTYSAQNTTWQDLDQQKVERFFQRVNQKGRFKLEGSAE